MRIKRLVTTLLVALPVLAGCRTDEKLNAPAVLDPMFRRYVSMGNSITAGFQSAGINDSTQIRSYANLLALAMGTSFNMPLFNNHPVLGRGCPAPFDNNVTQHRVGGVPAGCSLRRPTTGKINNVAFPGATIAELLTNLGAPPSATDIYKTFILGGRTQVELMQQLEPTFVSVFAGPNDVLGALLDANPGNPSLVTALPVFTQKYDSVLDAIEGLGARAVLVSVPDVTVIPYASRAAIWFCLKNGGCPLPLPAQNPALAGIPTFTVNVNCAPPAGLGVLVPWTVGLTKVSTAAAGTPASIDCTVDGDVVTTAELTGIATAVVGYNTHIAAQAAARGFAYFDINPPLTALVANGTIPPFPDIAGALVGQPVTFGPLFSLDGFHPSSVAHRLIADSVASEINQTYLTTLPVPVCGTANCPAVP